MTASASATAEPTSPDAASDSVPPGSVQPDSVSPDSVQPDSVSPGQPTPAGVRTGRAQIDDLDARILALIAERVSTAADIQAARIAEGGRRLDLKRETEIIARYRTALGRPGVTVAMAVLELCRGRV
jgi:chorismate mutase